MDIATYPIDHTKSGLQNLIALINHDNHTDATLNDLEFGPPLTLVDETNPRNTYVRADAKTTSDFIGFRIFNYWRVNLADYDPRIILDGNEFTTPSDVFNLLTTSFKLVANDVYLNPNTFPVFGDGFTELSIELVAKTDSLLYVGTLPVLLRVNNRVDVANLFSGSDLDGFFVSGLILEENGDTIFGETGLPIEME